MKLRSTSTSTSTLATLLIPILIWIMAVSVVPVVGQTQRVINDTQTATASPTTLIFNDGLGTSSTTMEVILIGTAPATISVVTKGCGRSGTCSAALNTYTTVAPTVLTLNPSTPYDYYQVVISWTGGDGTTQVKINRLSAVAKFGGSASITSAAVVAAFTSCSGVQYLGADGACHAAGGSVAVNGVTVNTPNFQSTDTPFNQLVAVRFSASGSNITARPPYIFPQNCAIWGDSISVVGTNSGATVSPGGSSGYANLLINNECNGWSFDSSVLGDMAADLNIRLYAAGGSVMLFPNAYGLNRPVTHVLFIGANEAANKQVTNYQTGVYRPSIYSMTAFLAIPRASKLYGQDAACAKTGTWTVDNTVLSGMGEKSNTNADTISCAGVVTTTASPFIYYAYKATDSNAGASSIKVDGAACTDTISGSTTLNYVGPVAIATTNGQTSSVFLARCAAAAGSHTVLITVTSATNASNVVSFQWVGAMPSVSASPSVLPRILHMGVLRQKTDLNATWTNSYHLEVMNMFATLSGDGVPIQLVPDHDYTVSTLPTPTAGAIADVTDGASATDCTTGSGSTMVRCLYSGGAWAAYGIAPQALTTVAANYNVDNVHLSDLGHKLLHDRITSFMGVAGGSFFRKIAIEDAAASAAYSAPLNCLGVNDNINAIAASSCTGTDGDTTGSLAAHKVYSDDGGFQQYTAGFAQNVGLWGLKQFDNSSDTFIGWSNSTTSWVGVDTTLSRNAAGVVQVGTSAANSAGIIKAAKLASDTNCAAVGTAASPSVAACGSASAGHFSCATNATGATCTVNTTAVTATSEIFVFESDTAATGTALSVTCNTSTNVLPASRLLASSVVATSFTINLGTVTTNPACFSYYIVN